VSPEPAAAIGGTTDSCHQVGWACSRSGDPVGVGGAVPPTGSGAVGEEELIDVGSLDPTEGWRGETRPGAGGAVGNWSHSFMDRSWGSTLRMNKERGKSLV